jgi:acyl-CoA synthetase (AMP-forming)/AMP-acid ligase II/acyl carrier protein
MMASLTSPAALDRMAHDLPDHDAVITDTRRLTFSQLKYEVVRAAAAMIAAGIQPGDRVAIWGPNTWHWVVAALAAHHAAAVVVPINTAFTAEEASDILLRSTARLLVATESAPGTDPVAGLSPDAMRGLRHTVRLPFGCGDSAWEEFLAGPKASSAAVDARAAAVCPDDLADILFTSGTTGRSKGVMCAHRQSMSASASAAGFRGMTPADRVLGLAPFFHNYGYKDGILGCLQTGATLVVQRAFDPDQVMRVIAEQRVTVLPGPPTLFQVLLDHPSRSTFDLASLRLATTGAATVPVSLVERIQRELGVPTVLTGYGLTEASGFGTMCRPGDDAITVATTCGRPIAGFELRIDASDDVGVGEVLLRGPNVMLGYLDDPNATDAVIDADGWLHTGDVGSVDPAGNLRITDRLKDVYICGGLNVYPAEVERVIADMDGVADVAVIGIPDPRLGEVGRAFIVAEPGTQLNAQEINEFARRHLANFKTPRSVVFLDALPRNPGGKVLKTTLGEIEVIPARASGITPQGLGGRPVGGAENWIADLWQLLLNIDRPGRRDRFTDLGGDSLAAAEFTRMLQIQFGVSISLDSLAGRPTIAAVAAGLESGGDEQRQPIVRLRTDGAGPICLTVPGIGGHAWIFGNLAQALAGPCDLWALSTMDLRDGQPDQMRTRVRVAALRALEPELRSGRPIVVAGYSFGAMIAADLACWLIDNRVPVTKLLLLDPDPLDSDESRWDPSTDYTSDKILAFEPGSRAARQLSADRAEVSRLLQSAYLDGSVRLPATQVAWLQSRDMAERHASAELIFGSPVSRIPKTILDLDHIGALLRLEQAHLLAGWLDQQMS